MKKLFALVLALLFLAGCASDKSRTASSEKDGPQKDASQQAATGGFQSRPDTLKVHFLDVGQGELNPYSVPWREKHAC